MNPTTPQPGSSSRSRFASPSSAPDDVPENHINFRELFSALQRGKWIILAVFWLCTLAALTYALTAEPEFEAYTVLLIKKQAADFDEVTASTDAFSAAKTPVLTEIAILKQSISLADQVAGRLMETATDPETGTPLPIIYSEKGDPLTQDRISRRLQSKLVNFAPAEKGVSMIHITATSTLAGEAALIANLYAEEYQQRSQETSRAGIIASRRFLRDQEAKYRTALDSTELQLEAFMQREGAVALDTEGSLLVRRMADLDAEIGAVSVDLGLERATLQAFVGELERIEPGLASRIASGVENEIGDLQRRIASLEAQANEFYANNPSLRGNESANADLSQIHRKIEQFRAELNTLSQQFVAEMMNLGVADVTVGGRGLSYVADLKQKIIQKNITIRGLEAKLDVLQRSGTQYEDRMRDLPRKSTQFAQLQREKNAVEELYLLLGEKAQEARVAEESELGYVEIVRPAIIPNSPVRPRKEMSVLLGMFIGLAFGIGLALVRQAADRRIYKPETLSRFDLDIIGVVPRFDRIIRTEFGKKEYVDVEGRTLSTSLLALIAPLSPIAECYRSIHTNLQFGLPDKVIETILVTSALPKEGKTVTSSNLAVTIARSGRRTLYVDADLRRPRVHTILGLDRKPGLSDILLDKTKVNIEAFKMGIDGLYVLPAGRPVPNPAELLGSKRMRALIEQLKQHFDVVVFDTAPVLLATDAVLLSTQCDASLMVVAAGQTDQAGILRTRQQLQNVGASLIGVVLNRLDSRGTSGFGYDYGYGDGYRYRYGYDYYGYADQGKKKGWRGRASKLDTP